MAASIGPALVLCGRYSSYTETASPNMNTEEQTKRVVQQFKHYPYLISKYVRKKKEKPAFLRV